MDYHMQFLEYIPLLQKHGPPYATYGISFTSPKMWTIICNFCTFFPFSENVDYHMQFMKFLSLLQKHRLSYAISRIYFSSPKTWTTMCNLWNLFLFFENVNCM